MNFFSYITTCYSHLIYCSNGYPWWKCTWETNIPPHWTWSSDNRYTNLSATSSKFALTNRPCKIQKYLWISPEQIHQNNHNYPTPFVHPYWIILFSRLQFSAAESQDWDHVKATSKLDCKVNLTSWEITTCCYTQNLSYNWTLTWFYYMCYNNFVIAQQ